MATNFSSDSEGEFSGFSDEDIRDIDPNGYDSDISVSSASISSSDSSDDEDQEEEATWSETLHSPRVPEFSENVGATFAFGPEKTELDFFKQFFTIALLEKIVTETNSYAQRCIRDKADALWSPTTIEEIMAFLGIHVLFSVIGVPSYSLGWQSKWPFEIPSIPQIMTRARFERLSRYFHVNDTTRNPPRRQQGHDKLCHVRPVIDEISRVSLNNYKPHREQSVDEGMIAFKGRLSFKQYLPAKPTKFGIKVWARADPHNGYVHEFQIYTGKSDNQTQPAREEGLGTRVVKDLTRSLQGKSHHVYMDNFFSSPKLFEELAKKKIFCTGTVRANRQGMPQAVKSAKFKNRGERKILQKGDLSAIAWRDKKTVYYLSTSADPTRDHIVRRRQKDGTHANIAAPQVAELYNKFMFGVDLADQKRMQYSTSRKAKKWWKYLFWFCFDLAVVNSFICLQESPNHRKLTGRGREVKRRQIDYRMALAIQLIGNFRGSRKRKTISTIDNCGNAHWPVQFEKSGRCKQCSKEKRRREVMMGCKQCGVRLCVKFDCFQRFHQEMLK